MDRSVDGPVCSFIAYPDAPLADAQLSTPKIHFLDELAGKNLILQFSLPPEQNVLRLHSICLDVGDQEQCFSAEELGDTDALRQKTWIVRFPDNLQNMQEGKTGRTLIKGATPKTFSLSN